jgi:hypothetical protein
MANLIADISRSAVYLNYYRLLDAINRKKQELDDKEAFYLKEIREKGYAIVENFFDAASCKAYIEEIDRLIETHKDTIWKDEEDSDRRVYGAEKVSEPVAKYNQDPFIRKMTAAFHNSDCNYYLTMAARMEARDQSQGSGGGWHRDSVHLKQIKSILYLTDVGPDNGPFQYLEGTHEYASVYETIRKCGITFGQNRFTEEEIEKILATGAYKLVDFRAPAGTLVLADTFGIHRGQPIQSGVRYAMTNYFYASHLFARSLEQKLRNLRVA